MGATVINLNSSFDWESAVTTIVNRLSGKEIAESLGIPKAEKRISERLDSLRWIVLVSDRFMEVQTETNEWGEGKGYKDRWHNPTFEVRLGDHEGSHYYMKPRKAIGGGVVESFGIYASDARVFAAEAMLKPAALRHAPDGRQTLDSLLPPDVGSEPMIFLCPERVWEMPFELVRYLKPGETRPSPEYSELFLRISLLHQIGHHLFPGDLDDDSSMHIREMVADYFCDRMLAEDERVWLFARSWVLQPSPYTTYFIPQLLEAVKDIAPGTWMQEFLLKHLGISRKASYPTLSGIIGDCSIVDRLMVSPHIILAGEALAKSLGDVEMARCIGSALPCAVGPFDEFAMPWRSTKALCRLLTSYESSLQIAAVDALETLRAKGETIPEEATVLLRKWSESNLLSDTRNLALRAWMCAETHRAEGLEDRYRLAFKSKHAAVYTDVPKRIRENLSDRARELLAELYQNSPTSDRRGAVAMELVLLCAEQGDHAMITSVLKSIDAVNFGKIMDCLEEIGYSFEAWNVTQLLAEYSLSPITQHGPADYLKRLNDEKQAIRMRLLNTAGKAVESRVSYSGGGTVDFTVIASAVRVDGELAELVTELLLRIDAASAQTYASALLESGGQTGDAVVARIVESRDVWDRDLLLCAARFDGVATIKALVKHGSDMSDLNDAFQVASRALRVRAAYEVLRAGEEAGNAWLVERYRNMQSNGSDADTVSQFLGYLTFMSIIGGWSANARLLLELGVDVKVSEKSSGNSLLHVAAGVGDHRVVQLLLDKGASANSRNKAGRMPLSLAAEHGHVEIITRLARSGASLDSADDAGQTALIWAALSGQLNAVRALLDVGASPRIADYSRRNAAQRALEAGQNEVAQAIIDFGKRPAATAA